MEGTVGSPRHFAKQLRLTSGCERPPIRRSRVQHAYYVYFVVIVRFVGGAGAAASVKLSEKSALASM
jgi:hypothetical protein